MEVTLNGEVRSLVGNPPTVGEDLPHFKVFDKDGEKIKTRFLFGKPTLISVIPNINTSVCSIQTKKFNEEVDKYEGANFLTVSSNTIEEQQNWCAAQGVKNMQLVSDHEESFGYAMKLLIPDEGILARSVWVVDAEGKITYREICPEIVMEPDYTTAIAELKKLL